ncbi:MAG TPA: pyridoxal phosphate-dependent aminotransferase [Vicinamibacterales bacterium]|jgi:aspartate aminotransferase
MHYLDTVPFSGIVRIRDMMYAVDRPFRLDQGDVSFDAPETVKAGMRQAIADNRSHYLQTAGVPRLQELLAEKLRTRNGIPVGGPDDVLVTNGGIHALYILFQSLLEPGDEVVIPDPQWPPTAGTILSARGTIVRCPLREDREWRFDLDDLASRITSKTRVVYLNSPHNPTGGVLTRADVAGVAELAQRHNLWVVSDEAYEDVVFGCEHISIASIAGMYPRTIPVFTFSKTYAMTGLRLGYMAVGDPALRDRIRKMLFFTASNVSSVVQYGGIGALEGSQDIVEVYRAELEARRDLFYAGIGGLDGVFTGRSPRGAFYAFLKFDGNWRARATQPLPPAPQEGGGSASASWELTEYLIRQGRIGCIPGADFGPGGERHLRFCFARDRAELEGAIESLHRLFA